MKKIFLSAVLLLTLFINTVSHAAELVLYSQDGFEIRSDAYAQDDKKFISLVKDSNLFVSFTDGMDYTKANVEPKVSFSISKEGTNEVMLSVKNPSKKMSGNEGAAFDAYIKENKAYFDQVALVNDKVRVTVPLKLASGKYVLHMVVDQAGKKSNLDFAFAVSDSSYTFTQSDIVVEDTNVLANIGYSSLSGTDATNTVSIVLSQGDAVLFSKKIDKKFYAEGTITIDENIAAIKDLKGIANLKIEILNADGKVILSESEVVDLQKSKNILIYYMIVALLILLPIILFLILHTKKSRMVATGVAVVLISVLSFVSTNVSAVQTCNGVDKPADRCVEGKIVTSACEWKNSCSSTDANLRKFFSTGRTVSVATEVETVGPVKASIDVCSNISDTVNNGDTFYVVSDSSGSSWQRKKMHVYKFTKGTQEQVTFDPGGDKRNVNYAVYNGGCSVSVYSKYSGISSNYKNAKVKIAEVGKITSTMCRAKVVNDDLFESNSNLLGRSTCENSDLRNTYIAGSVYMQPVYNEASAWQDKTVNICKYLGITSSDIAGLKSQNKSFYTLMETGGSSGAFGSFVNLRFPVYAFKFGTVYKNTFDLNAEKNSQYGPAEGVKYVYRYTSNKENAPSVAYDGSCNITFRLYHFGSDTDSWSAQYSLIETGMVSDATCRDPLLVESTTADHQGAYKYSGEGIAPNQVETETKDSRYKNIAPFFPKLGDCTGSTSCHIDEKGWIDVATDQDCSLVASCGATNNTCGPGQNLASRTNTTTEYKWACVAPGGDTKECSVAKPTGPINGECSTSLANICTAGDGATNKSQTSSQYAWTCPGSNSGTPKNCTLPINPSAIGDCGATVNTCDTPGSATNITTNTTDNLWTCPGVNGGAPTSCSLPRGTGNPPDIDIKKTPLVTLNKGGQCTISWEIKDMPTGATCILSGWGVGDALGTGLRTLGDSVGTEVIENLQSNQKYVITCSGGGLSPVLSKSVICRVNPDIKEN